MLKRIWQTILSKSLERILYGINPIQLLNKMAKEKKDKNLQKKAVKKEAVLSLKEKRAAKKEKQAAKKRE